MAKKMTARREKFETLAEKRVIKAIKDLRLIGNLANRSNYSYDQKDAEKIIAVLESELKLLKRRFADGVGTKDIVFKL